MKFLSSVRRGRKKSDASQGGNSQASAEESQSGTQGSHTGKSKRRPSLFAFSPRLRTDSAAEAGTGVGAPSRDLPPCIALRLRVRGVSRYRVCSADPQGEYAADNWVLMVGEFQQDFFLPAAMLGPKSGRDGVGEGAGGVEPLSLGKSGELGSKGNTDREMGTGPSTSNGAGSGAGSEGGGGSFALGCIAMTDRLVTITAEECPPEHC
mmetsp:Transcript_21382/g.47482  ORF Transcript_21382/g.47482 Transcript_21382/m.47482 type:complete len:208 (+) Transcript_21382:135-758(+)